MTRIRGIAAVALLLLVCGCGGREAPLPAETPSGPQYQDFAHIDSPSLQYVPREEEVKGWSLRDEVLVFPAKSAAQYLGSDANHFLAYGLLDLTVGNYVSTEPGGFATLEVFRFPDFIQAFGAYSTRRKNVVSFLDIPDQSFTGPHSIHIWRGAFYVRIIGASGADQKPLLALARTVTSSMAAAGTLPAVFRFFPEGSRVAHSEAYQAGPALGQPYLNHAFTASFKVNDQQADGVIVAAAGKEEAGEILQQLRTFFVTNGRLLDQVPNLGEENLTGEDRHFGRAVAFRLDRFVVVYRGYGPMPPLIQLAIDSDQRILDTIRHELKEIDRQQSQE
ncbi:MAG: DUF6599 family protein [Thermoanaerobaculia bacterium]